jgi:hypothetical protein
MPLKPVPLNALTLYADLMQNIGSAVAVPESVSIKTVSGKRHAYAVANDGNTRPQRYLGPAADPAVQEQIRTLKANAESAKRRRSTVSMLKRAGLPAPILIIGRLLEVIANAGYFARGMTLVGTAAYQTYSPIVGHHLSSANLMTNDADLSVAEFIPACDEQDFLSVLQRADPTFAAQWNEGDKLPKTFKADSNDFLVELLTKHGRGRTSPVAVKSIGASAVPLVFQEYLAADAIDVAALYGSGVRVRVPQPARYAVHKLMVANRRRDATKQLKDLAQAKELALVLRATEPLSFADALDDARSRGREWGKAIALSAERIGLTV